MQLNFAHQIQNRNSQTPFQSNFTSLRTSSSLVRNLKFENQGVNTSNPEIIQKNRETPPFQQPFSNLQQQNYPKVNNLDWESTSRHFIQ